MVRRRQKELFAVCNRMFNYLQSCMPFRTLVIQLKLTQAMKLINTGINWNSCEQFQHLSFHLPLQSGVLLCQKDTSPKWQWNRTLAHCGEIPVDFIIYRLNLSSNAVCLDLSKRNSCKSWVFSFTKEDHLHA